MKNIIVDEKELNLINELLKNEIKFNLSYDEDYDVDSNESSLLIIEIKDLRLCIDINYLVSNDDDIEELRFHDLNELINFLKNY
jgi:hypothetical protein